MTPLQAFYEREGYIGPFTALPIGRVERSELLAFLEAGAFRGLDTRNRHLDLSTISRACAAHEIVARVTEVLGPNPVLWRSQIFGVSSRSPGLVWHQDDYRTLLQSSESAVHCAVQLNLTTSTRTNSIAVIPGSHRFDREQLQRQGYAVVPGSEGGITREWMLPRDVRVQDMMLAAGQFFIFHPELLHASVHARFARNAGSTRVSRAVGRRLLEVRARLTPEESTRWFITMRIARAGTRFLPAAFSETPRRANPMPLALPGAVPPAEVPSAHPNAPRHR